MTSLASSDRLLAGNRHRLIDGVVPGPGMISGRTGGPPAGDRRYPPFAVREGPRASDSLRSSVSAPVQPARAYALRFGLDTRLESGAQQEGKPDPNGGGLVGHVSPEVVVSPLPDLVVQVGAHFPVLQALGGHHREGPILAIGAGDDL
ncbi:MAG: hypothetical protein ABI193_17210 [Minicystis sp.]